MKTKFPKFYLFMIYLFINKLFIMSKLIKYLLLYNVIIEGVFRNNSGIWHIGILFNFWELSINPFRDIWKLIVNDKGKSVSDIIKVLGLIWTSFILFINIE